MKNGVGYVTGLKNLVDDLSSELCFKPFNPEITFHLQLIWRDHIPLSKPAQAFLKQVKHITEESPYELY